MMLTIPNISKEINANFCTGSLLTTVLEAEAAEKATVAEAGVTRAAVAAVAKIPAEEGRTGKICILIV